jgi:glucan biosynthesis protein C
MAIVLVPGLLLSLCKLVSSSNSKWVILRVFGYKPHISQLKETHFYTSTPWHTGTSRACLCTLTRERLTLFHHRSMASEQRLFAWGAWAWIVAAFVVASAIQVSLSFMFHGGVLDLITSYLLVLANGIVYGPLVLCRGQRDTLPVLESQSYLPVDTAGSHEAQDECLQQALQCATKIGDEDADADAETDAGATLDESMEIEGVSLESVRQNQADSDIESFEHFQNQSPNRPPRLHFLDNVKTFLTAIVVSFHVNCAFGGCGHHWFLVVGEYSCGFHTFTKVVALINQAYFMPLFFFISAYFTPASYDRKGRTAFLRDKARRLWIPAIVTSFTIVPASLMIGMVSMGASPIYVPFPGHCWFLFWLLALNYAYCTIRKGDSDTATTAAPRLGELLSPFPTSFRRYLYGGLVCGLATFANCAIFGDVFYAMPVEVGSLPSDLLLFCVGVVAMRNQWLSWPIEEQMDISVWYLLGGILLEVAGMLGILALLFSISSEGVIVQVLFFVVAGFFCLDMSLAVLQLFQRHLNLQTNISRCLAESAYTVYLIHPLVIASVTSGFIWVYNSLYHDSITFEGSMPVSKSHLEGPYDGSLHLAIGWVVVNLVSHAIVWPLAWGLRQLPGFKSVL